jgi:hypothetical protein
MLLVAFIQSIPVFSMSEVRSHIMGTNAMLLAAPWVLATGMRCLRTSPAADWCFSVVAAASCRSEVLAHITSCLAATPQSLGDPRKDTPEELEERFERITAASMAAAAALLSTLQQQAQQAQQDQEQQDASVSTATAAAAAVEEVSCKLEEVLQAPGFFKKQLGSKSVVVRRAAYGLVRSLATGAAQLLRGCQAAAAPAVLGSLQVSCWERWQSCWQCSSCLWDVIFCLTTCFTSSQPTKCG